MKTEIKWQGGMAFEGSTESGHSVLMDAAPQVGGENRGPRPMEMVLLGLGGCTSIDIIMMLNKSQPGLVKDCQVEVTAERADSIPKVFTKIHVLFKVYGQGLNEKKVARAVGLSAEKYCSVSKMLEATVEMSHDFEIIEA
ncbi:OsmC family protein [Thiomicrorhabdus sp. ZW0627]|uniref:OsmC family protein n=1 Tax=Thiomicrorhabdus sp. ZW0627 TaxID=3039774 RepID=UPI002436F01E|nr:OsmC family protein [Thiomicrorhabdus sp. ZW0627]MDG6774412.1 OsmC family protein [Thiomicrorhabdus sp. ZW0627]